MFILPLLIIINMIVKFIQETNYLMSNYIVDDLTYEADLAYHVYDGLGMLALGYGIGNVMAGVISDKTCNRVTAAFSFVAMICASFCLVCISDVFLMKYARFLLGIGLGGVNCCVYIQIKEITPDKKLAVILGRNYLTIYILAIIAPILGTYVASYWGWRCIFLISGVSITVVGMVLSYALLSVPVKCSQRKITYTKEIYKIFYNSIFANCCIAACLTIGQAYGLQALAAQFQDHHEVLFDKSWLCMLGRCLMCIGIFGSERFFANQTLSFTSNCGIMLLAIATMLVGIGIWFVNFAIFALGFALSYAAIGISQPAIKAQALLLGALLPGTTQGLISIAGAWWEWLFNKMLCSLIWPHGAYISVCLVLLSAYYINHASKQQQH